MRQKSTPALLALSAAIGALVLILAGCGGSSGGAGTSATAPTTTSTSPQRQGESPTAGSKEQVGPEEKGGEDNSGRGARPAGRKVRREIPVGPLEVSGGGSAQFRVEGGDNSVQEYGEEAGATELEAVAEAVHSFFVAEVRGEWARACSRLAAGERTAVAKLLASSSRSQGNGCAAGLAAAAKAVSPSLSRQVTTLDAASLRYEGEQAFLLYTAPPGRTVYAMPLRREDGGWWLGAISGAELPGTS